ncbi:MAG TPA: ABC transporter ATP-binding protein [Candidatus Dormibacteraeota bacterium]|jgi:ABC-2 type transport system ATP-binding protein|nr:ABC transporter ATP-binding protein [Candidatus Dormibacteraeota bacterium]
MSAPVIQTEALTKSYGRRIAVNHLNLTVESKQIHGFLGPNGAGKTTTIKMLVGLLRPDSGSLKILGANAAGDRPKIRERIGYMPELPKFPKHLTGEELLDVYGRMYNISREVRKKKIPDLLKLVGLEGRGRDRIGKYSKGMQQRIGIAQALLNDPELVILDEPSIGLDPVGMVEVRDLVKGIVKGGQTVFFSSHLLAEVQQICDHVTIIHNGNMMFTGTLDEVSAKAGASRSLVVEVQKANDAVLQALKALPFAVVDVIDNTYTLHLKTNQDVRADVSRAVSTAGGVILRMQEQGGGLEDAFMSLVGKEAS